jgi:hypothetical protein
MLTLNTTGLFGFRNRTGWSSATSSLINLATDVVRAHPPKSRDDPNHITEYIQAANSKSGKCNKKTLPESLYCTSKLVGNEI